MAEEDGDKTEAPTQRRREEAREQGQVARSPDLTAATLLLAFMLLMNTFGTGLIGALRRAMEEMLSADWLGNTDVAGMKSALARPLLAVVGAAAPLLLGGVVVAIVINLLQVGFNLNTKKLAPNFAALNPMAGFGRIFSRDSLVHTVMSLLKLGLVLWIGWSAVSSRMDQVLAVQERDYVGAFALGASVVYAVGIRIAVVLFILALLDYGWQRFSHEQKLRMTKQEIKEEMRHMEGDPKIKQRRRQIAMQMAQRRLKKDVPTADVIVTNPTHFAIALKYDEGAMHAPRVIAKGQDLMARRIRELAIEAGVPILERPPLARALYKLCKVGEEIPEQFYAAVAEILAYVYELSGKNRRNRAGNV
jgi:flagellar biosynthesis protein FlhB